MQRNRWFIETPQKMLLITVTPWVYEFRICIEKYCEIWYIVGYIRKKTTVMIWMIIANCHLLANGHHLADDVWLATFFSHIMPPVANTPNITLFICKKKMLIEPFPGLIANKQILVLIFLNVSNSYIVFQNNAVLWQPFSFLWWHFGGG